MSTRKPVAVPSSREDGQWVIRARPDLEFDRAQVALALAVTYGAVPRVRVGPTSITAALHHMVEMALDGDDITAPESTITAWSQRLAIWGVWPADTTGEAR